MLCAGAKSNAFVNTFQPSHATNPKTATLRLGTGSKVPANRNNKSLFQASQLRTNPRLFNSLIREIRDTIVGGLLYSPG